MSASIYDFCCKDINGEEVALEQFRSQVMLIVNTASFCGFTPQYRGLEYLYRQFHHRGFVVLAFPCNQFVQEPFDAERIGEFCTRNYAVSFPLMAKIKVNGHGADDLYRFLKQQKPGFLNTRAIKWNFTKFLVDADGQVVGRYSPAVFPRYLKNRIDKLLKAQEPVLAQ